MPDVSVCDSTPSMTPLHEMESEMKDIPGELEIVKHDNEVESEDRILVNDDKIENFGFVWCFELRAEGGSQKRRVKEEDFDRTADDFKSKGEFIMAMICVEQYHDSKDAIIYIPVLEHLKCQGLYPTQELTVDPKYQVVKLQQNWKINARILNAIERGDRRGHYFRSIKKQCREATYFIMDYKANLDRMERRREWRKQQE